MPLFFKSKEERQKEFDTKQEKQFANWLKNVEETIKKKTRKINYAIEVEQVTPKSYQETLTLFHDTFGYLVNYGAVLSGQICECNFCALLPFPSRDLMLMRFEIPIQIDWEASYVHKGGGFSTAGTWICRPWDGERARQMNQKFPRPVVGYYYGGAWTTKEEGGHICTGEGGTTELVLYPFCTAGKEAITVASYLNSISDVVSLLSKWSNK